MNTKLTIISLAELHRDGRVQRQIEYLSKAFDVSVIAYDTLPEALVNKATMLAIDEPTGRGIWRKMCFLYGLVVGKFSRKVAYDHWYWSRNDHQQAYAHLMQVQPSLIHANDWQSLPLAARIARETGAKLLLDLHEYAPLQYENRRSWRLWRHPMINYFLRKHGVVVDRFVTVGQLIAERYEQEFGFATHVVMNAPQIRAKRALISTNPQQISLVHHGLALPDRQLELMIQTTQKLDERFSLHMILVPADDEYSEKLRQLASAIAPGRIFFHEPVKPADIADRIAEFDIGIFILPFTSFSYEAALPNKFFEFISAGLAVCIGPSPEMAQLCQENGFGIVAPDFEPESVAKMLNSLTAVDIDRYKQNAINAREHLNADIEMSKLVALHQQLAAIVDTEKTSNAIAS